MMQNDKESKNNLTQNKKLSIIKNNTNEEENASSIVNIIVNKFTKGFSNSSIHSDTIQSALEYNNFLICKFLENKNNMSKIEQEVTLNLLWKNLNKLSKNADTHVKNFNLSNNKKYCEIYTKKKNEETSTLTLLKNKSKRVKENNHTGLVIVVDKSILLDYPPKDDTEKII
jgi:hypothetical protein